MGCLVERYREDLTAELPEVSGWYGLGDVPQLHKRLVEEAGGSNLDAGAQEHSAIIERPPAQLRLHQDLRRLRSPL